MQILTSGEPNTQSVLLGSPDVKVILKQTDKLRKNLQNATTSAAQGQDLTHHCTKNEVFH